MDEIRVFLYGDRRNSRIRSLAAQLLSGLMAKFDQHQELRADRPVQVVT